MSDARDVAASWDEPHDEITALVQRLQEGLPEDARYVLMLDGLGRNGMVAHGYADDAEIAEAIDRHRDAFRQARPYLRAHAMTPRGEG